MKAAVALLVVGCALVAKPYPLAWAAPAAPGQSIGDGEIAEAIAIGFDRGGSRAAAFHERYIQRHGGPVLESLEVVTEFRRVVLLAEDRMRRGDPGWDARSAARALEPYRGRLDLVLRLRFSPQNAFHSTPSVDLVFYRRDSGRAGVKPVHVQSTPSNLAGAVPLAGTPILAASVEAAFPASALDFGSTYLVGIFIDGREVERVPLDLSPLR